MSKGPRSRILSGQTAGAGSLAEKLMDSNVQAEQEARILIREIQAALDRGTKHFSIAGVPLTAPLEIINASNR